MLEMQQHLDFKDLFPQEAPLSVSQYLEGISRNDLIRIAMLFLHIQKYEEAKSYTIEFCSKDNPVLAQYLLNRISELKKTHTNTYYFIGSNIAGLKLLQFIFSIQPQNATTKSHAEIIESITKALLLINQNDINDPVFENRGINQDSILPSIERDGGNEEFKMAKNIFCNQVVYYDFVNYPIENLVLAQISKAEQFFYFSEHNSKFKILTEKFLEAHHCNNSNEYLQGIIKLIILLFQPENRDSEHYPIVGVSEDDITNFNFLLSISLNQDEQISLESNFDSLNFRDKPLIYIGDGKFLIINYHFAVERLYNSIKFNIASLNKTEHIIKNVFADYTTSFSEEYLFNTTIETIYNKYHYKKQKGSDGLTDYYIRNGNKIFLFECKDIEYASEIKQSNDFVQIKEYIWEKLVLKKGKPIGIGQLIRDIEDISNRTRTWEQNLPNKLQIFPILVIAKPAFSSLGFNYMLNKWFSDGLAQKNINKRFTVYPLIVIDMDTLLLLKNSFYNKTLIPEEEFRNYYTFLERNPASEQKYKSFSDYTIEKRSKNIFSKEAQGKFYNLLGIFVK